MHVRPNHPARWLAPLVGALAIGAFPAAALAAPPVNTTAPAITIPTGGASNELTNPSEGRSLTSTPGAWNPAQTKFSYQWTHDCSAPGVMPVNLGTTIAGATNATYKIANGDITHTLCLTVSAGGSTPALSAPTGVVSAGTPIDRSAPTMSGVTQDGQTLTASPGTWDGTGPISYTYAWRRCDSAGKNCGAVFTGAPSPGATYTLQDADLGHTMSVVVTATNSVGTVALGSFATNTVVTPGNTGAPAISGTAQDGKILTESHGSWVPSNPSLGYQWESCDASGGSCSAIAGATSQTYKLTPAEVGHTVVVQETASQAGATSNPASSAPTGVVQAAPSTNGGTGGGGNGGQTGNQGGGQTGGQPTPNGNAPVPAAVNAAQLRGLIGNALTVHGQGARIRALLKRGGYSLTFAAPSAGRLAISWYRVQHGRKTMVATVNVLLRRSGKATINVRLTRQGRNLLKHARRLTLAVQGGFTPVGQSVTTASRTITLKN